MAVESQDINRSIGSRGLGRPLAAPGVPSLNSLVYLLAAGLALVALYALLNTAFGWGHSMIDDWRYGNPRTSHLSAFVGHEERDGSPTHLIAMNLDRQVVIIEIPGGDPSKTRTLSGPYLFGVGEDKTPVLMQLADVNHDSHEDLVVRIKNEEMVYINHDGQFQLITPEQRRDLIQSGATK